MPSDVRIDLAQAHHRSLAHVASAGCSFTSAERLAIADVARASFLDANPTPPWVRPFELPAHNVAYRLARHAGTLTEDWYRSVLAEGLTPLEWIEVVGIVVAVVPVVAFARAAGTEMASLPAPNDDSITGLSANDIVPGSLNWVPVSAALTGIAAVVQALSALPSEFANLWQLAEAQYMTSPQMRDPAWTRGTLSRMQMEFVASRISRLRECFY